MYIKLFMNLRCNIEDAVINTFYMETDECLKMGLIFGSFGWKRSNEAERHGVYDIQCLCTVHLVTLLFGSPDY